MLSAASQPWMCGERLKYQCPGPLQGFYLYVLYTPSRGLYPLSFTWHLFMRFQNNLETSNEPPSDSARERECEWGMGPCPAKSTSQAPGEGRTAG